ncbi:von Willebrand factor type A domain protein [Phycisphaerae bacterium RAS1]|nr:von Willebrand factor type A domain protein [Phycisphaerae bacterium RAS1]
MRSNRLLVAAGAILATLPNAASQPPAPGEILRIDATRWVMANGRVDDIRSTGILTPENPGGRSIPGVTPVPPPPPGTPPPPPASVLDVIAASADPMNVTLDLNKDGKFDDAAANPLIAAGALVPSGFTLAIAERVPGAPLPLSWIAPVPRFGGGNFYATVSIPAAGIVRGQELVTKEHYEGYTANSVIYESPDIGLVIVDNNLDGGTKQLSATANRKTQSRLVGYSNPLQTEIVEAGQSPLPDGRTQYTVTAVSDNGAEAGPNATYRWAVEARSGTSIIDVVGAPTLVFTLPFNTKPEDLPLTDWDEGQVKLTVVSSGWGPVVPAAAMGNPFLTPLPPPPQSVGLRTFVSAASTLSDTHVMYCKGGTRENKPTLQRSLCVLIDASGSMKDNNKMVQAKASAARVLQRLAAGTEVCLIVFYDCGRIVVEHAFTTDPAPLIAILPRIQPSGGTPLAAATAFAKDYMRKHASGATLDLVILSDGEESCGGDPLAAARD